ncbi:putative Ig domain-containing protein [Agrobacterium salinitolerans]|nr:putative Ig domain-containing protein [Agrobacterium salinitolerans]
MHNFMLRAFISLSVAVTPIASAYAAPPDGVEYIFRHKKATGASSVVTPDQKDITAFFVAGVGYEFSARLPMKPQWQDDSWSLSGGTLPDGISFDPETLTFSGKPSSEQTSVVADLVGTDESGEQVATARATFDVRTIVGEPRSVDIYAHTNKYKFHQLPVPSGITVDKWTRYYATPPGIDIIGRNFDGTPTQAGEYPVLITGENFMGETVITYFGRYLVEDGPSFPKIADDIRPLPKEDGSLFDFGAPSSHSVNYAIENPSDVRYFLETATPGVLPGKVVSNDLAANLKIRGRVYDPYKTATVRYKAIDADDTVGYSNWFEFGTADPQPGCGESSGWPITWYTDKTIRTKVPMPKGAQGRVEYTLASGTLPDLVSLNKDTGYYEGKPMTAAPLRDITVNIDVVNPEGTVSTQCKYTVQVKNSGLTLSDDTSRQDKHIRTGATYNGKLKVDGGIAPWSVSLNDGITLLPTLSFDAANLTVTGTINEQTLPYQPEFKVNNGDGNSDVGTLSIYAHGPLKLDEVPPTLTLKRYDDTFKHAFSYDADTVIPDLTTFNPQPTFSLSGTIPETLGLKAGVLSGGVKWPAGTYGPYQITMSDYTKETTTSKAFSIVVAERDPMLAEATNDVSYVVETPKEQSATPFTVKQPPLATDLAINWTITGSEPLPAWASLNRDTGEITVAANIPYADLRTYGPYTVTATDSEGYDATSEPFHLRVTNWPDPIVKLPTTLVHGNVTGNQALGEDPVFFTGPIPDPVVGTFIDSVATAKFLSVTPQNPAGLGFDPATGQISGVATSEYNGPVQINFEDGRKRAGVGTFNLVVHPYPRITALPSYDLPRIADAIGYGIVPTKNAGFWGSSTAWRLAPGSAALPEGLSISPSTGEVIGRTSVTEGSYPGIIVQATDTHGSGITAISSPFAINVTPRSTFTIEYSGKVTFYLNDSDTGDYTLNQSGANAYPAILKGSYATPVTYEIVSADPSTLSGVSINSKGVLTGFPATLGEWTVTVRAKDADGVTADGKVVVKSTLEGYVEAVSRGASLKVRAGETFQTAPLTVKNVVGSPLYSTTPVVLPSSLTISGATGEFYGRIDSTNDVDYEVDVWVKDADGRGFYSTSGYSPIRLKTNVEPPLEVAPMAKTAFSTRQYSASEPIDIAFPATKYAIGKIRWSVSGDFPGVVVNQNYDDSDNVTGYNWTIEGDRYELDAPQGTVVAYRKNGNAEPTPSTAVSAYLPLDALVLDTLAGTLKGIPSRTGIFSGLVATAHDAHAKGYFDMGDPTRVAYNNADANPFTITVEDALPLEIAAAQNPKAVIVPGGNADLVPFAKNAAYGRMQSWSLTGASILPTGITAAVSNAGISFSGYSEQLGSYKVTAHGTDALGRNASLDVTFKVMLSTDPIGMTVADIVTKPGFDFTTAAPATDNTFGNVRFYSNDISTNYSQNMTLASATGVITGGFDAVNDFYFDLFVTDDTNRITSKPVHVQVIPFLRIVAPSIVTVTQGDVANVATDTAYNIGAVAYRKGGGDWPAGLDVDPATGAIKGTPIAEVATYNGFTIIGVDGLGDERPSNVFSIKVNKKKTTPTIANITDKALSQDKVMTAITPVVTNGSTGDVYSVIGTLPTGVSINDMTGVISGMPTESGIFPIQIRIRDVNGNGADTNVFSLKVTPALAMAFDSSIVKTYSFQTNLSKTVALPVLNAVGKVTYTRTAGSLTAYTINADGTVTLGPSASAVSSGTLTIRATDELNRTASIAFTVNVVNFAVTGTDQIVFIGTNYTNLATASVSNAVSTVTYTLTGLPSGMSYNATTGAVSGTPTSDEGPYTVGISVEDDTTGATASAQFTVMVVASGGGAKFRYWRVDVQPNLNTSYVSELEQFTPYVGTVAKPAIINPSPETTTISSPANLVDGSNAKNTRILPVCPAGGCTGAEVVSFVMDFGTTGVNLKSFRITDTGSAGVWSGRIFGNLVTDAAYLPNDRIWISKSNDMVTWTPVDMTAARTLSQCGGGSCGGHSTFRMNY